VAFPTTPLPIFVGIAPGANPVDLSGWNFTDISDDIRSAGGVQVQVGRQDESDEVDATQVRAVVDNRSGNYSRVNPNGTWFGQLAKGTPLAVAITRINDAFSRSTSPGLGTDSTSGLTWSHDSSSPWDTNGSNARCSLASANTATFAYLTAATGADMEVTCSGALSAVTTGAAWVHAVVLRMADTSNFYRLHTEFGTGGTISCKIAKVVGGVSTDLTAVVSTGATYTSGTTVNTRARITGSTLQIRAWLASGSEPTTWTCQVDDSALTSAGMAGLYEWRVGGNTNAGTLICTIDNYRADVIRAVTPVPEWPVRWDQSGRDVTAPINGAGILRRLSQGQGALRSPMYRQLPLWSPAALWPLEDGSSATTAASAVTRVGPATCADVTFGADGPPGAASAIQLNSASSTIKGIVTTGPSSTGYSGMFMFKLSALPGLDSTLALYSATGTVTQWQIVSASGGSVKLNGYDSGGSAVVTAGPIAWGTTDPTQWSAIRLRTTVSGGTVTWDLAWIQVNEPIISSASGTYAGTAPKLTGWTATGAASTSYSMSFIGPSSLPFTSGTFYNVMNGFSGELAGDRLTRLCDEENIPLALIGSTSTTASMGAQSPATLLDLLHECEAADQGVLHERGSGLGYLTRVARHNPTTIMALDFSSGHIAAPPEPTDDDQRLRNQVRLTRTGGSSVTVQDDTSITANGTYLDELTVNLATDGLLTPHAYWRLHLGTLSDLRWPRITLNLARNPSLIPTWCQMRIGSRITVANPPSAVAGASLDLIVEGWTETLTDYGWDVELACSPAAPWQVAVFDSSTTLATSQSTTLGASATTTATSLTFSTVNPKDVWSTTNEPYDVLISGERITVTSMAAATGTGPYTQTATVTRSVNGIVKAHASGEAVALAVPVYAAV